MDARENVVHLAVFRWDDIIYAAAHYFRVTQKKNDDCNLFTELQ